MIRKIQLLAAASLALLSACSKSSEAATEVQRSEMELTFSAEILTTRTSGNEWIAGDTIGVFMYNNGTTSDPIYQNIPYVSDADGNFTISGDEASPIYYPQSGKVDLYAYYPYNEEMEGTIFESDAVGQNSSGQSSVDLLLTSLTGLEKSSEKQLMSFSHQLSKLIIELTTTEGVELKGDVTAQISGIKHHADVDILGIEELALYNNKEDISFTLDDTQSDGNGSISKAIASAIMIPHTVDYSDVVLTIAATIYDPVLDSECSASFSSPIFEDGFELQSGYSHTFAVTLTLEQIEIGAGSTIASWSNGSLSEDQENMDADKVSL